MSESKKYYLPEYVRFSRIDDDRGVLSGPIEKHVLEGDSVKLVAEAVPLLRNGTTTVEIAEELQIPPTTAEQLLARLSETDLIRYQADIGSDLIKWASSKPEDERGKLAESTVAVLVADGIVTELPDSLRSLVDISLADSLSDLVIEEDPPDLLVTIAVGEAPEFHRAVLDRTWSNGVPWLPARLVDSSIKLGPYTLPETDACYNCYYKRLLASAADREIARHEHEQDAPQLFPSVVDSLMWSLAHIELVSIIMPRKKPATGGAVVAVNPLNMSMAKTDVLKLPGCEVCGTN